MECELKRIYKGIDYTIGELYIDGVFICSTLEDKVYGETAIPIGRYKVVLSYSNRFKRILPEILNVEFFKGIRIHEGNHKDNTEGCILVGECKDVKEGFIYNSKNTMKKLMAILQTATDKNEEIFINVH